MGQRPSKATALKIVEGNPGKRPIPENEPQPRKTAPNCPYDISPSAQRVWQRLAPKLERLGLLTEIDGDSFAALCQIRAHLASIHRRLRQKQEPMILVNQKTDPNGNEWEDRKPNPLLTLERQYYELLRKYAGEFGLSPRGRTGLTVGTYNKADEGEDLLS